MPQCADRAPQRGLLVAQAGGGCLPTPRVLDFLCFDTPRSVLGDDGADEELPFYFAEPGSLEELVHEVRWWAGRAMGAAAEYYNTAPHLAISSIAATASAAPQLSLESQPYRVLCHAQCCGCTPTRLQPARELCGCSTA